MDRADCDDNIFNRVSKRILTHNIRSRECTASKNTPSGYILTFSGTIEQAEMQRWHDESKAILAKDVSGSFGVIINMKDLQPLSPEARTVMVSGQKLYKDKGMKRSAVILNSAAICQQFKNFAVQSGIYLTERYIDASSNTNPLAKAVSWVKDGIDPDV